MSEHSNASPPDAEDSESSIVDVTPVDGACPACGGSLDRVAERTGRTRRLRIPGSTTEVEVREVSYRCVDCGAEGEP